MKFNLSEFFIKNSVLLLTLVFLFLISGIYSYVHLKRNEDPGFKIRTASIVTDAKNLSAKRVDNEITKQIENVLFEMEEIEDVKSRSYAGQSVIYAELFEKYKNIQPIWDRLRRKVDKAKQFIPDNLAPFVNDEYGDVYGAIIAVSLKGSTYEQLFDFADKLRDEYLKLKNVAKVDFFASRQEVLYIKFRDSILANLKITLEDVKNCIDSFNAAFGGGNIVKDSGVTEINSQNALESDFDFNNAIINIANRNLYIKDIFDIQKTTLYPPSQFARLRGCESVILGLTMKEGGNILKWGDEIKKKTDELKKIYNQADIEIFTIQSDYVKKLIQKFTSSLFESVAIVIAVVFFILGLRTALAIGFIILLTIASSFFVMDLFGIGLDKISLSALIISLGILVDNSIVVAQGILCNNCQSLNEIKQHILDTAYRFQTPLFIVTLTTSLAFLPVFIADSTVSEYASSLFKVVFITLLFSWFYSLTLMPYLMHRFGFSKISKNVPFFLTDFFSKSVDLVFKIPKKVILAGFVFFFASLIAYSFVPKIFFPDSDRSMFEIRLNLRNSASIFETDNEIKKIENKLSATKNVNNYISFIGTSAPRYVLSASPEAPRANFGMVLVCVNDFKNLQGVMNDVKSWINQNVNAQSVVRKIPLGPPVDAPVEIRVIERNIPSLFEYANKITNILKDTKGVYLVKKDWGELSPFYNVKVDPSRANSAGVNPKLVFDFLTSIYSGYPLTYYYRNDVRVPVVFRGSDDNKNLDSLSFYSKKLNGIIPLSQIANIQFDYDFVKILRMNNSYVLTVQAWVEEGITANDIVKKIDNKLKKIKGLNYEYGGVIEKSRKGNKSIAQKIPAAFLIILVILIGYFNDIKKPLLIALCGIMALSGANFGLLMTKSYFGFMTFLGYICLVGICMNNGVILLNEIKENNKTEIINAAKSRIEPVLLTCLTTIGGMFPLWVKNDSMFSSLAIAIIFGLVSSIMITLLFLPLLYYLLFGKNLKNNF